jgi:hypothetical protein
VIELKAASCRAAVPIFGNKRALMAVALKDFLADTGGNVAIRCIVSPFLSSAGKVAFEGYGKDAVDQVLLTEVSEALFGLSIQGEVLPSESDDLGRFSHCLSGEGFDLL